MAAIYSGALCEPSHYQLDRVDVLDGTALDAAMLGLPESAHDADNDVQAGRVRRVPIGGR